MNNPSTTRSSNILSGFRRQMALAKMWLRVSRFILRRYPNPARSVPVIRKLRDLKRRYSPNQEFRKLASVEGRVFYNPHCAGWPSKQFLGIFEREAKEVLTLPMNEMEHLRIVQIALTKKCPLSCEHCYEADELNRKEVLSLDEHKQILDKLHTAGTPVIQYGGGEPMARLNDLEELLRYAKNEADFWIFTSGYNMSVENAIRLKAAGLTGVFVSIDHYDKDAHNRFRRNEKAFGWAMDAIQNCRNAGLVVSLSICVTREYCTREILFSYLRFAGEMGVSFVQILEPRAVGNYKGKDVTLNKEQLGILEQFYIDSNCNTEYISLPIVIYPEFSSRRNGCPGAGAKYIYIDTNGYINSCPFCRNRKTRFLDRSDSSVFEELVNEGCFKFEKLDK